ncbi:MAG: 1-acyl-sn-glycerol-3-phosphate acyltransferase [Candidatus Nanopelagicales bacterium]
MNRSVLADALIRKLGWKVVGAPPDVPAAVLIGAPHTSNWDLPIMLAMCWARGAEPRFLMKQEVFKGPAGVLFKGLGGIPVDRSTASGLVGRFAAEAAAGDRFQLAIAPEGTRKLQKYWKSGFYRIALEAGVPLVLGYVDGPSKTMGFGPAIQLTGDVTADMDVIRQFYADKRGIVPAKRTEARLREEEKALTE